MSDDDKRDAFFHLGLSHKRDGLPDCGKAVACDNAACPAPNFEMGFGMAGGGYGVYEFCDVCGHIVSKTESEDE